MHYSLFHTPNWCSLIDNYFRHQTLCSIRKLTAAFISKIGVFSRFSWTLDFGAKMAEFPLPVLQIWWSRKRVAIQIQLMNIHVSEYKYYCLHLVPKFGDVQGWGQFHFSIPIPIPIPLFSIPIPIPIPLLTKSFNSNSNSNSGHFNSNSNSGEFKSNLNSRNDLLIFSSKLIMIKITRYMYIKSLLFIPSVSYPLLNGYNYMALVNLISIAQYKEDILWLDVWGMCKINGRLVTPGE